MANSTDVIGICALWNRGETFFAERRLAGYDHGAASGVESRHALVVGGPPGPSFHEGATVQESARAGVAPGPQQPKPARAMMVVRFNSASLAEIRLRQYGSSPFLARGSLIRIGGGWRDSRERPATSSAIPRSQRMITVLIALAVAALIFAIVACAGKVPLYVPVLLIALIEVIERLPLGK